MINLCTYCGNYRKNPMMKICCVHVIKRVYQKTNAYKFNTSKTAASEWGTDLGWFEHTAKIHGTTKEDEHDRVTKAYNGRHESKEDIYDDGLSIYYDWNRVQCMSPGDTELTEKTWGAHMHTTRNSFYTWSFKLLTESFHDQRELFHDQRDHCACARASATRDIIVVF
jgi:hypothetical protein